MSDGTKGTRQTLKDFMSMGETGNYEYLNADGMIDYVIDGSGTGHTVKLGDDLGMDPGIQKDLLNINTEGSTGPSILGDFVKYITTLRDIDTVTGVSDNLYSIEGEMTRKPLNRRGDSLQVAEAGGADDVFQSSTNSDGEPKESGLAGSMWDYSDSGYLESEDLTLKDILNKLGSGDLGKPSDPGTSGHTLLKNVLSRGVGESEQGQTFPGSDAETNLETGVDNVLKNNRFTSVTDRHIAYAPKGVSTDNLDSGEGEWDAAGTSTYQRTYGDYDPYADMIVNDDLLALGKELMDAAAGTLEQVYTDEKIPESDMRPDIYGSTYPGTWVTFDDADKRSSYGTTTKPDMIFSTTDNQNLLIAYAAAAITAAAQLSKTMLSDLDKVFSREMELGAGPYVKGMNSRTAAKATTSLFVNIALADTSFKYHKCVEAGYMALFGTLATAPSSNNAAGSAVLTDSPGYWLSVARGIINSFSSVTNTLSEVVQSVNSTQNPVSSAMAAVGDSNILGFLNALAMTGDAYLMAYGNPAIELLAAGLYLDGSKKVGRFNVDILPEGPATRIMKSRGDKGHTQLSLAWRGSSVPALYMIPVNVMRTALDLGTMGIGTNPLQGHMSTPLIEKTYIDGKAQGDAARIPMDIVQRMENSLDAEYVPFYFHDLRTNEIVTFHAFLTSLSDRFSPTYTSSAGLGRMDSVKTYKATTRSIGLSFYVVATSKEDFDEMWFKINKLTTLVYPKWTAGTDVLAVSGENQSTFVQPFSQVMAASPLVRLRVGDVIKGNYSRFNLARLFGIGDGDHVLPMVLEEAPDTFLPSIDFMTDFLKGSIEGGTASIVNGTFSWMFGSPLAKLGDASKDVRAVLGSALQNGFVNPIGALLVMGALKSPDTLDNPVVSSATVAGLAENLLDKLSTAVAPARGYIPKVGVHFLKANNIQGYLKHGTSDDPVRVRTTRPLRVRIISRGKNSFGEPPTRGVKGAFKGVEMGPDPSGINNQKTYYTVQIWDLNAPYTFVFEKFDVTYADLMPNYKFLFMTRVLPFISLKAAATAMAQGIANTAATATGLPAESVSLATLDAAAFMQPENNPITKAFESTAGRGLAGVIKGLTFDWLEFPWETDWNARAPIACKVELTFDAIHDIPPGLDYSGYNRAPIYNVGDIMHPIAGDQYGDNGLASKDNYTRAGGRTVSTNKPPPDDQELK